MKHNLNHTGQIVAALSFVIGTCLLSFYLYFGQNCFPLSLAITFIISAVIINSILFVAIIGTTLFRRTHQKEALITCGLMLLNIPIALLYFYMVVTFPYQNIIL